MRNLNNKAVAKGTTEKLLWMNELEGFWQCEAKIIKDKFSSQIL